MLTLVRLNPKSHYAQPAFQQEGFGHLKLGKVGKVVKAYSPMEVLVEFEDEGTTKSNIYTFMHLIHVEAPALNTITQMFPNIGGRNA